MQANIKTEQNKVKELKNELIKINNDLKNLSVSCSWVENEVMYLYKKINQLLKKDQKHNQHYLTHDLNYAELLDNLDKFSPRIKDTKEKYIPILQSLLVKHVSARKSGNVLVINVRSKISNNVKSKKEIIPNEYFKNTDKAIDYIRSIKRNIRQYQREL